MEIFKRRQATVYRRCDRQMPSALWLATSHCSSSTAVRQARPRKTRHARKLPNCMRRKRTTPSTVLATSKWCTSVGLARSDSAKPLRDQPPHTPHHTHGVLVRNRYAPTGCPGASRHASAFFWSMG